MRSVVPGLQGVRGRAASKSRVASAQPRKASAARQAWNSIVELFLFSPEIHERMQDMCESSGFTPGLIKSVISPALAPGQPVPMRKLASEWHCDPSYVTMQVRELEQRGLAERHFNPEDHRFKTVVLTDKGEQVRSQFLDQLLEPPGFFEVLTAAEQRQLKGLLEKLVEEVRGRDVDPPGDAAGAT